MPACIIIKGGRGGEKGFLVPLIAIVASTQKKKMIKIKQQGQNGQL
jgi:hypothetical protein